MNQVIYKYLRCDITGFASRREYGKEGDKVKVISLFGNVTIVESPIQRFPVQTEHLSDQPVTKSTITNERPSLPDPAPKAKTNKKTSVPEQKGLF